MSINMGVCVQPVSVPVDNWLQWAEPLALAMHFAPRATRQRGLHATTRPQSSGQCHLATWSHPLILRGEMRLEDLEHSENTWKHHINIFWKIIISDHGFIFNADHQWLLAISNDYLHAPVVVHNSNVLSYYLMTVFCSVCVYHPTSIVWNKESRRLPCQLKYYVESSGKNWIYVHLWNFFFAASVFFVFFVLIVCKQKFLLWMEAKKQCYILVLLNSKKLLLSVLFVNDIISEMSAQWWMCCKNMFTYHHLSTVQVNSIKMM